MVDYYNLLGVPRTATAEQIKAAFRREAKRSHPDAHAQAPPRQQEQAQQRFIQLAQAYETLSHAGMRRAYDEKLQAEAASQAQASPKPPPAGKAPPAPEPPHNPNHERQQRAEQVRRPSPEGERQARMDERRRATERQAEERQRRAEHARRERERAQREAQEVGSRKRRAHAQAEAARAKAYGRVPRDRPLEELVQDVEALLARFGLDLRTPAEVIWDTLLTWAQRIFRDTEPPKAARPRPQPSFRRPADARPRGESHGNTAPPRPEPPPKPPPRRPSFRDGAVDAEFREIDREPTLEERMQDLEAERDLSDLKRKMGKE